MLSVVQNIVGLRVPNRNFGDFSCVTLTLKVENALLIGALLLEALLLHALLLDALLLDALRRQMPRTVIRIYSMEVRSQLMIG